MNRFKRLIGGAIFGSAVCFLSSVAFATHITAPVVNVLRTPLQVNGYLEFQTNPVAARFGDEWTGWVDIRSPVLDGTEQISSPFDRSNRQIDVKTIIVSDNANPDIAAAPSTARDFDFANKIYAQAGISILHELTGGGSDTLSMDGTGGSINIGPWGTGINQTNEDDNMKGLKRSGNATTINNYYVKDYDPNSNGLTSGPSGYGGNVPRNDGVGLATDSYVSNTGAHEWAHMAFNGASVHSQIAGDTAHSSDPTNLMWPDGTKAATVLEDVGILGKHDILTDAQSADLFANDGANNPGFVQKPTAVDHTSGLDKYGNLVDWNFVVDSKEVSFTHKIDHDLDAATPTQDVVVTGGLEDEANGADAHKGVDGLFWGKPSGALTGGTEVGHKHTGLGEFDTPGNFTQDTFRFVDVFSNSVRYSDYETSGGSKSIKEGALDYGVTFRKADGTTAAGTPVVSFKPGWTTKTNADDYVTRWVAPFDATGVLVKATTTDSHDGVAQIDAVIAGNIEHSSTGPKDGYIAGIAGDPTDDFFVDVKTDPLSDEDPFETTWAMHVREAETNYAGFLFDISYDGSELSALSITPAGPHVGMELPGGNGPAGTLLPGITLPGSISAMIDVGPIAAWIAPAVAGASGTSLAASDLIDLIKIAGMVKNTTPANNSDIDIDIRSLRIKHVPGDPVAGPPVSVVLEPGDFLYITPGSAVTSGGNGIPETGVGFGLWQPIVGMTMLLLPPGAFYATGKSLMNMGGLGIEHVPEPAGIVIMLFGVGFLAIGWVRRRVTT